MNGRRIRWLAVGVVAGCLGWTAVATAAAVDSVWINPSGDSWSTPGNWSIGAAPSVGTNVYFGDVGAGNTATLDANRSINMLVYSNTANTWTLDLNGKILTLLSDLLVGYSNAASSAVIQNGTIKPSANLYVGRAPGTVNSAGTLTVGTVAATATLDAAALTSIYTGHSDSSGTAVGTLDLTYASIDRNGSRTLQLSSLYLGDNRPGNIGTLLLPDSSRLTNLVVTGNLYVGAQGGTGRVGRVSNPDLLPDNLAVQIGSSAASRGNLYMGRGGGTGQAVGQLVAGTGDTFTMYGNTVWLGWTDGGATALNSGILDLRNAAIGNGVFDVTDLRVGNGGPSVGVGRILFNSATGTGALTSLVVGSTFYIGQSKATGRIGTGAAGDGPMPAGLFLSLGVSASSRAAVQIGWDGDGPLKTDGQMILGSNSTVSAYVSDVKVGYPSQSYHACRGLLDLRYGTLTGAGFDVGTALRVAAGGGTGSGEFDLGPSPDSNTVAKSPLVQVGQASGATGLLQTFGTIFQITSNAAKSLDIRATGAVTNHIYGLAAGFALTSNVSSVLNIDAGGKLRISFESDPAASYKSGDIFCGFRWAGNQTNTLMTYTNTGALAYSTAGLSPKLQSKVGIAYNAAGDFSYIGLVVPPPTSAGVLMLLK